MYKVGFLALKKHQSQAYKPKKKSTTKMIHPKFSTTKEKRFPAQENQQHIITFEAIDKRVVCLITLLDEGWGGQSVHKTLSQ
jgi:hypothetical protein